MRGVNPQAAVCAAVCGRTTSADKPANHHSGANSSSDGSFVVDGAEWPDDDVNEMDVDATVPRMYTDDRMDARVSA